MSCGSGSVARKTLPVLGPCSRVVDVEVKRFPLLLTLDGWNPAWRGTLPLTEHPCPVAWPIRAAENTQVFLEKIHRKQETPLSPLASPEPTYLSPVGTGHTWDPRGLTLDTQHHTFLRAGPGEEALRETGWSRSV